MFLMMNLMKMMSLIGGSRTKKYTKKYIKIHYLNPLFSAFFSPKNGGFNDKKEARLFRIWYTLFVK